MCFDGPDLFFTGDGAFSVYMDRNDDGVADGAPQRILPLDFLEHGGHAMRKGPDGWWYLIAGNETHFTNDHITLRSSPVRQVEAGALLRISPDGQNSEVVAHGFRNPYDFDFNWLGDLFTCDSDVEADFFLPWYLPTRAYHIAHGGHHGWRLEGWKRSWPRPDYSVDTVSILARMGRGSPTGVTSYRHFQFPPYYRDGLFACDWTFGRIYFLPVDEDGASYSATPEVFLEPMGTHGFAPTDIVVTPDGALLVSIGGRNTRGAVYRIEFPSGMAASDYMTNWLVNVTAAVNGVLNFPQPLEAWARALWMPAARNLGPVPFVNALADNRIIPAMRVRAVEILTEMHGGLPPEAAAAGARTSSSAVRARVAWSLGRVPSENFRPILSALARDPDPLVRRCALESLADRVNDLDNATIQQALAANLAHPDKRIRQCAARLAVGLPESAWNALWTQLARGNIQARLTATMALLWRSSPAAINVVAIDSALAILGQTRVPDQRLQAIRLIMLGLGDYHLYHPSVEVYTGYEPALSVRENEPLATKIQKAVADIFPSRDPFVDFEAARLLAMVEATDPSLPGKIIPLFTERSAPGADFHYLTVLSHLSAPIPTNAIPRIAQAILSLDRKLEGTEPRNKQNWTPRMSEVVYNLIRHEPKIAGAVLAHPNVATPGHLYLVPLLGGERYLPAARLYLEAARRNPGWTWSAPLVELISALPLEEVRPVLRQQWSNAALRDDLVLKLAQKPEAVDREKFIIGLGSLDSQVARASINALLKLPRDESGKVLLPAMRLLRRLMNEPNEQTNRAQVVALLNREGAQSFKIQEQGNDPDNLKRVYQPVFDWFNQKHPLLAKQVDENLENPASWNLLLKTVQWEQGYAPRGELIFQERACQTCHAGNTPLGPDLSGVAYRFSPIDLFQAIVFPSRDVAPAYRTTTFQTRDGQTHTGLVVFESADGVILQAGAATTVRLADSEIVSRKPSPLSLMPNGLLGGLNPHGLADLYAYLKTIRPAGR